MIFVLLLVRFIWILAIEIIHNRNKQVKSSSKEIVQSAAIMTFGGAKGAVTLAIMFTIPATLANGQPFPGRQILLFIAGGVVVITLVLSNFILPLLMPSKEKIIAVQEEEMKEDLAIITIDILRKVIEDLNDMVNDENRSAIQSVIKSYSNRITSIKKRHDFDYSLNIAYRKKAFFWEREYITEQLIKQNITPKIARKYLRQLGNKEDLLENHTSLT